MKRVTKWIQDERDLPFIWLIFKISISILPLGIYIFLRHPFSLIGSVAYLLLNLGVFIGPFTLMLHNTSHRPLFRKGVKWGDAYMLWILCPFFGQTPHTYFVHHVGMHHPENNLGEDTSSTLKFQRDSVGDFCKYLFRFFFMSIYDLCFYLRKKNRPRLLRRALLGEITYFVAVAVLSMFHWKATLVVFVIPLIFIRFAMIAGNWAQHAFVDSASPESNYRNSITCINTSYNLKVSTMGIISGITSI
ncbi:fatty acid desaturase [bacterium]|nr:fatty acid desaturase [bacterium]